MNASEIDQLLARLRSMDAENEVVEFKEANNGYDFGKLGKYFSALCNEANLMRKKHAWLVFGIENQNHKIVGTRFRPQRKDLDSLKKEIADRTTNRITFIEIHESFQAEGRVVLFQIPAAPGGLPVAFDGHYYGRDGESLSPLNIEEIERIRFQDPAMDWSAEIVPNAKLQDLDPDAIAKARTEFKVRNPKYALEVDAWDDSKFLDKAKITRKGKITRTAILLLGKSESEQLISPAVARVRWLLKNLRNEDKDFEIFTCPFILAVDQLYGKIRNLKYRYLKEKTLFPDEVLRYEPFNIREPLNNCIAHQDYTHNGMVNVVEFEDDRLVFTNCGSFLPKSIESVIESDAPEEVYRNPFLVEAMRNLNMVETQGGGIKKLFNFQRARFFPMPDYEFAEGKVKVTIMGRVLDVEFARILARNPSLNLIDIMLLDRIQKRKEVAAPELSRLRKLGLVEGRKPNIYLSHTVTELTGDDELKAQYIKNRSFDDTHFKKMIIEYLIKYGKTQRRSLDTLLINKLSDGLSEKQKKKKVTNLLTALRIEGKIKNTGYSGWELT